MRASRSDEDHRVLVVDDEEPWHRLIEKALMPWTIRAVHDGVAALEALDAELFDLVLLDRRFEAPHNRFGQAPDREGEEILRRLRERPDGPEVLVLTAHGDVEDAVRCMRLGARDFATKDRSTLASLKARIVHCLEAGRRARDLRYLKTRRGGDLDALVGESAAMVRLRDEILRFGASGRDVLVLGETGTGKELVARALHGCSPRCEGVLREVNCATWTGELLGPELFGIEAQIATGVAARAGQFELADGGSLFLDELVSLPLEAQGMLLRLLETRRVTRIGGTRSRAVDLRLIFAANRPLEDLVAAGSFREDLYYRVRGLCLELPPLRARLEDIPLLGRSFLAGDALGRALEVDPAVWKRLAEHGWPGNVRELRSVLLNGAVYASGRGRLEVDHLRLPPRIGGETGPASLDYRREVARRKVELLVAAWERCDGMVTRLHELLGLPGRYAVRREVERLHRDHPDLCRALPARLRRDEDGETP